MPRCTLCVAGRFNKGETMTWIISKALMDAYENSHSLQEAEGESSEVKHSDGEQFAPLNVMPTPHPFWLRDKTMDILSHSRFIAMSAPLTDDLGEDVLTWFREDSRARISPQQGRVQESRESGQDYGEKWHALSVKYDPATYGWKTVHSLFPEALDWSCLTLPKWGMMQGGELWERTTQVDFTSVTESGSEVSWPTPRCAMASMYPESDAANANRGGDSLATQVEKRQSWPSPIASSGGPSKDQNNPRGRHSGNPFATAVSQKEMQSWPTPTVAEAGKIPARANYGQVGLNNHPKIRGKVVRPKMQKDRAGFDGGMLTPKNIPTPTSSCWKGGVKSRKPGTKEYRSNLDEWAEGQKNPNSLPLSPDWVEWLMGWPIGWTTIGPLPELDWRDWSVDPADEPGDVPRVANGINNRIDRLRAIGNGQCPQALVLAWNELSHD